MKEEIIIEELKGKIVRAIKEELILNPEKTRKWLEDDYSENDFLRLIFFGEDKHIEKKIKKIVWGFCPGINEKDMNYFFDRFLFEIKNEKILGGENDEKMVV